MPGMDDDIPLSTPLSTPPTPKELALAVGLTKDASTCRFPVPKDDKEAHSRLRACLDAIPETLDDRTPAVFAAFSAQYLPDLIKSFLRPEFPFPVPSHETDRLYGSDALLLFHLDQGKYFTKYFLSSDPLAKPAGDLVPCLTERFQTGLPYYLLAMQHAPEASIRSSYINSIVQTSQRLHLYIDLQFWQTWAVPIPQATVSKLVECLDKVVEAISDLNLRKHIVHLGLLLKRDKGYMELMDKGADARLADHRWMTKCCSKGCRVGVDQNKLFLCSSADGHISVLTGTSLLEAAHTKTLAIAHPGNTPFGSWSRLRETGNIGLGKAMEAIIPPSALKSSGSTLVLEV